MEYPNKKPDFETESLRSWKVNKKDNKKYLKEKEKEKHPIVIKKNGAELNLMGFFKFIDDKTNKLKFAFKIKHNEKLLLFFIPDDTTTEDNKLIDKTLKEVKQLADFFGYSVKDSREYAEKIFNEMHVLDKLSKQEDK